MKILRQSLNVLLLEEGFRKEVAGKVTEVDQSPKIETSVACIEEKGACY